MKKIFVKFAMILIVAALSTGFASCDDDEPKDLTENNNNNDEGDDTEWYNCPKCKDGTCIICDGDGIYGGITCYKCNGSGICNFCDGDGGYYL